MSRGARPRADGHRVRTPLGAATIARQARVCYGLDVAGATGLRLAAALVVSVAVAGPDSSSSSARPARISCDLGAGASVNVSALPGVVVQQADIPRGWRFERMRTLPKGTSADGPSSHRIGGAVAFARRPSAPDLALTSTAELEPRASVACRTFHNWIRTLLTAGVGARSRPLPVRLGREHALLESNEPAFGPMVSISWYRGPVYAVIQVQYRTRNASAEAHRVALHFATASDRRIRPILR